MLRGVAGGGGLSNPVNGPGSSTDNAIARWDGTTGAQLQDSSFALMTDDGAETILGTTATSPGLYVGIAGDTVPRISLGINASDIARIGMGPGGASARDTFLTRAGAANLRLGIEDAAAPVAQTLSVQNVVAGTSDTAGVDWSFNASRGTGTGSSGGFIWNLAPAGSSGSSQNALVTTLSLTSSGGLPSLSMQSNVVSTTGPQFVATGYGISNSGGGGIIHLNGARGTIGSPTAVQSGDFVGGIGGKGYDGTSFPSSSPAAIHFLANANFVHSTNYGTTLRLLATPAGSATRIPVADFTGAAAILYQPVIVAAAGSVTPVPARLEIVNDGSTVNSASFMDTQPYSAQVGGAFALGGKYNAGGSYARFARITGWKLNSTDGNSSGYISFSVNTNVSATGVTEIAQINPTGLQLLSTALIQFGGSTSSFPALKRSTTSLIVRLADDSADTLLQASAFKTSTALVTAVDGGSTAAFTANMVGSTGGPTTAAQNGWVKMQDSGGATIWVPVWK